MKHSVFLSYARSTRVTSPDVIECIRKEQYYRLMFSFLRCSARNRALNRNFTANNTVNNEAFKSPMLGSKTTASHQQKKADDVKAARKQVSHVFIIHIGNLKVAQLNSIARHES